jgi:hypothetical protein
MSAHQVLNIADLGERGNRGLHGRFPSGCSAEAR